MSAAGKDQDMQRRVVPALRRRNRRGAAVVEFCVIALLCFAFLFGIIEFTWVNTNRGMLMNGCAHASRHGSLSVSGTRVEDLKNDVRTYSTLSVDDSYIQVQVNSAADGSGTWSDATDAATGNTLNVASGMPIRVKVNGWRYHLLSGQFFSFLPGASGGTIPLTVYCVTRHE
jgi:Flp pilus assembly protein TadG